MTREEAIEILQGAIKKPNTKDGYLGQAIDMAIKALKQEPKTGHWRPIYQGDEIIDYRCTECEFGSTFGKSTYGMNFCPYCGADMREVDK